jgi:hypothetical protein
VLAFMKRTDTGHARVRDWVDQNEEELVSSPFVLAELDHLVQRYGGADATLALREDLANGAYPVEWWPTATHETIALAEAHASMQLGLTGRLAARARRTPGQQADRDTRRTALARRQAGLGPSVHAAARRRGVSERAPTQAKHLAAAMVRLGGMKECACSRDLGARHVAREANSQCGP